jgi:hypothetical protein
VKDPHPDKGRAIWRLEQKQGRTIHKGIRAIDSDAG